MPANCSISNSPAIHALRAVGSAPEYPADCRANALSMLVVARRERAFEASQRRVATLGGDFSRLHLGRFAIAIQLHIHLRAMHG